MDMLTAMATFVRVADLGSFSKAAAALKLTPSGVSRQLRALEDELGAQLFARTTRHVALTEEGARFVEPARRTVLDAEEARSSVVAPDVPTGLLVVSMPTAMGLLPFGRLASRLVEQHPGFRIDLRLEDHAVDMLVDGVDVAIRAGLAPPDSTILARRVIAKVDRLVVAAPSYLKKRGHPETPEDLSKHTAIVHLHPGAGMGAWTLVRGTTTVTIAVNGSLRANALHAIMDGAVAGAGIAILPRWLISKELRTKALEELPLSGFAPARHDIYALVRAESKDRPRIRAFIDAARALLDDLSD